MKYFSTKVILACMSLVLFGNIYSGTATAEEKTTITMWAWDDNFNIPALKIAADYYKRQHPEVDFDIVSMSQEEIVHKLNTALLAQNVKGLPDIVLIEDLRVQGFLSSYPGAFRDMSDISNSKNFMQYKIIASSMNEKVYGVPFDTGVTALFYRTDLIEQAGYTRDDIENNITWEKYIEIGKTVKKKTGVKMLTLDPNDLNQIRTMLQSAGSWYVKADGKTINIANNQALKDAIKIYKKLYESDIALMVSSYSSTVAAFQNGEIASVVSGCWQIPSIEQAKDLTGKWALAPTPRMAENSNSVNASNYGGSSWYVINKKGNADIAADVLKSTFASSPEFINDCVKAIGVISTLKAAENIPVYSKKSEFFSGQEIYKLLLKWANEVPGVNYGIYTYFIDGIIGESVQEVLRGSNIDETLKNAQSQAEASQY